VRFRAFIVHFRARFARFRSPIGRYRAKSFTIVQSEDAMRRHPHPQMELPISMSAYQQLLSAASETGFEKEFWEIGESAIRDWMIRHHPNSFDNDVLSGYQWKHVFLPNGTLLRTVFDKKNHHCTVEGDELIYKGLPVSPSGFVNAVGGTRRNAWKTLWILFPNTTSWKLAGALRTKRRPRHTDTPRA
jgi:hypothetical protein